MTKVVHPYAHRLGIIRDWKSRWFVQPKKYFVHVKEDVVIRDFLEKRLRSSYVSSIDIERNQKMTRVMIHTSRPGMIIGRQGEGSQKLKNDLLSELKRKKLSIPTDFKLDIVEVQNPDADAAIVACSIADGLEKRLPFRRVMKQAIEKTMSARGVLGARIYLTGRLGGAEMARSEELKKGSIPLQTIRADVDFSRGRAHLPYGDIGIKVWIYKGQIFKDNNK